MKLDYFKQNDYLTAVKTLFKELDVPVNYLTDVPAKAEDILQDYYKENETFGLIDDVYFVGMVDDAAFKGEKSVDIEDIKEDYDGILIFALTLHNRDNNRLPTRSQLAEITRAFNRKFHYTPVVVLFKYNDANTEYLAFANSERLKYKQQWREGEKTGKVSLLRDINVENPHRGHLEIIEKLKISRTGSNRINSFSQLYYYWQSVFSISILNKNFYEEIIGWFNRAVNEIKIPGESPASEKHKDFTIRLIARLIFIWFLKELKVVKEELFLPQFNNGDENNLIKPEKGIDAYYKFVLQNLFFNALNAEKEERDKALFDVYATSFSNVKDLKDLIFFSPYLNGGLFDIHPNDWCQPGEVNNAFVVPDYLFLDKEKGINSILAGYKFTIAENTPLEEEIAVDPEMLGRIFENLLAEQSDDTKEVARKNVGAFYTPRPVVSYMCRNTLLNHLGIEIKPENGRQIVHKMLNTTVLDPACGSGAFPMGMLEEMMQILDIVDPEGNIWVSEMLKSNDVEFKNHIADFIADKQIRYVKKLGLLRNCLFGIDLLEYAVEITKLRSWLSLIVEQKVDFNKPNYNLKPLPNLEFKFYKKNSLLRHYKDLNLNENIDKVDNDKLLDELLNLENEFFIAKSGKYGDKEEIKQKIVALLEKIVDKQIEKVQKSFNSELKAVHHLVSMGASEREINKRKKKQKQLADELGKLAVFRNEIKDYFIERIVFPGIFNPKNGNPGFDIVIGNPPYVNTKQISKMGLTAKLQEEYGFVDDLYNHFTVRGLELLKKGGLLSYITSDTFLTLQTKQNMRREFLGIPTLTQKGDGLFADEVKQIPESKLLEVINTPKAFSALVDTAIFTVKKEQVTDTDEIVYVDLRHPDATTFEISEQEWELIKTSRDNFSGWERVLEHTFKALDNRMPDWEISHTCDADKVYKDINSNLLKYKLSFEPYRKAINYVIFSPTKYNCQILEKIIKPARPVFDRWWKKIETSRLIENNRIAINTYTKSLQHGDVSIIGLLTDGGQGLATGNNGRFVGYKEGTRYADKCRETRIQKLYDVLLKYPDISAQWPLLKNIETQQELADLLYTMREPEIWQLFDEIKEKYGLRVFGKGYMYRIIPPEWEFDPEQITTEQKLNGIEGNKVWVPYDKGDREGNRWYLETPYLIDWSKEAVTFLKNNSGKKGIGMPVVRNPQFYFRNGFCWTNVLNPNSTYIKTRLKDKTVNDVGSMSLYDEYGVGDKYFVTSLNSFLFFKILREFFNTTVNLQMNDIRKLPIKIPTEKQLKEFNAKFDVCFNIQKRYFKGDIDKTEANILLRPVELEIDQMVNELYEIEVD